MRCFKNELSRNFSVFFSPSVSIKVFQKTLLGGVVISQRRPNRHIQSKVNNEPEQCVNEIYSKLNMPATVPFYWLKLARKVLLFIWDATDCANCHLVISLTDLRLQIHLLKFASPVSSLSILTNIHNNERLFLTHLFPLYPFSTLSDVFRGQRKSILVINGLVPSSGAL